jgi:hypothetical protein
MFVFIKKRLLVIYIQDMVLLDTRYSIVIRGFFMKRSLNNCSNWLVTESLNNLRRINYEKFSQKKYGSGVCFRASYLSCGTGTSSKRIRFG